MLAHNASAGSLPAPAWLLGYLGAMLVLGTALVLRGSWGTARLRQVDADAFDDDAAWTEDVGGGRTAGRGRARWLVGHIAGSLLLGGVVFTAFAGSDEGATNIAPVAVFIVWWVVLPMVCLAAGDAVRAINPFVPVVQWVERMRPNLPSREHLAPAWTAALFLWAFEWFFVAYHRPGSPRAVGVFLAVYIVAALAGGVFWGTRWLMRSEGFAGLSAGIAGLVRPRPGSGTGALLPIAIVLVGATAFDAVSGTGWWIDIAGATTGWTRTAVNTVGLVWLTSIAAVVALSVIRVVTAAEAADGDPDDAGEAAGPETDAKGALVRLLGVAFLPLALGWFLSHDLTLLLADGQNAIILASDPLGRGWDLFGTAGYDISYGLITAGWVRWVQLLGLLAGHGAAVVLAHDGALAAFGRRRGMRVTWAVAVVAAASIVAAALLVVG